jgi:SSS family solute:Na+ symporter
MVRWSISPPRPFWFNPNSMLTLLLFITLILALVWFGIRWTKQPLQSLVDFFLAGQTLGSLPIALTFVASWFGAASTIGTVNAVHQQGLVGLWQIAVPSVCSCLVITLFLAKRVHAQQSLSQPQAVEQYYGRIGRLLLSLIILASTTTFVSAQMVAGGQVCQTAFGLDQTTATLLISGAVVAYSVFGGFLAVVITDVVQFMGFTLAIGLLLAWIGWTSLQQPQALATYWQHQPHTVLAFLPQSLGGSTGWIQQLGLLITFVLAWCIAPEMWQRMTAVAKAHQAFRAAAAATGMLALLFMGIATIGVFSGFWIPATSTSKTVLIDLALAMPHPLLTQLVIIGVLSAITSTMDSSLNVGSLTVTHDLYHRWLRSIRANQPVTQAELLWVSRLATVAMASVAVMIALRHQNLIQVLWMSADIYASAMFIPVIGLLYHPQPPKLAGILAMALGLVGIVLGQGVHAGWLPWLSPYWPAWPFSTLVGVSLSAVGFGIGCIYPQQVSTPPQVPAAFCVR